MPKIALRYVGDDKALQRRLESTDGKQYFEPVDAREVIASGNPDYEIDDESRKLLGVYFEPRMKGLSVPQLQGEDAELQTGLSHEKYGRSQVVKAVPDALQPPTVRPMNTTDRPLNMEEAQEQGQARMSAQVDEDERRRLEAEGGAANDSRPALSEGLTKDEIIAELDSRGVAHNRSAKKEELADLLDRQPR
jgi:hypothetical protein